MPSIQAICASTDQIAEHHGYLPAFGICIGHILWSYILVEENALVRLSASTLERRYEEG
jgi:hypothetical protein